ncbi:MAG TPA: SulP family inorganic anion transporter, partial [Gemmataceae bacterium]|nr:SulP family inorganic anion transporter [Gemmataceae bacterium]
MSVSSNDPAPKSLGRDLVAGLVVFLVALPLCLGIALASRAQGVPVEANVPLFAGVIAGIVGGILVGVLSGSHTSVAGPAAGLTAVVAAQIAILGSFQAFLLAVVLAGVIQIVLGLLRAGFLSAFFPSSVVKGLLAAIGVILILKQIPHVLGHDTDPEGDMAFQQPDNKNTFTELANIADVAPGAALVGILSVMVLVLWDRSKKLKKSVIPAPLVVVVFGIVVSEILRSMNHAWVITGTHLVQVPVATSVQGFFDLLAKPGFSKIFTPAIYLAAFTIAAVASLETLLNLEAVDKIDTQKRVSPASRELIAQGVGNVACGLVGGLPVTSVIVRSSVNINAGAQSKKSAVFHGILLLVCVALLPTWLNKIPLSCLAAILLVTGLKLASPKLVKHMWKEGWAQFLPFIITVVAIVLTDLLVGVLIGLGVSLVFILYSNARRPLRRIVERHLGGEVTVLELANQVSFLNRAALEKALNEIPRGGHVLVDARNTDYIDPDVKDLLLTYRDEVAPARGVQVSWVGFREKYNLEDHTQFVDYSTRELQSAVTPEQVLQILKDGHERFKTGQRLSRNFERQMSGTAAGQHPLAVVLSCIDSRAPAELVFDCGLGDI